MFSAFAKRLRPEFAQVPFEINSFHLSDGKLFADAVRSLILARQCAIGIEDQRESFAEVFTRFVKRFPLSIDAWKFLDIRCPPLAGFSKSCRKHTGKDTIRCIVTATAEIWVIENSYLYGCAVFKSDLKLCRATECFRKQ